MNPSQTKAFGLDEGRTVWSCDVRAKPDCIVAAHVSPSRGSLLSQARRRG